MRTRWPYRAVLTLALTGCAARGVVPEAASPTPASARASAVASRSAAPTPSASAARPSASAASTDVTPTSAVPPPSSASAPATPLDPIAWTALPGTTYSPQPLATTPPPHAAPLCRQGQLKVLDAVGPGDTQDDGVIVEITNTATEPCLLEGPVRATLHGPGVAPVVITSRGHVESTTSSWGNFDMAKGEITNVWFHATTGCLSGPAHGADAVPVTALTIDVPSGGSLQVDGLDLPRTCGGPTVGEFWQRLPEVGYAPPPLAGAVLSLELPATVHAGDIVHYTVTVTNPTDQPLSLVPCPSYIEWLTAGGTANKELYALNCDGHTTLAPHQTLRWRIELPLPAWSPAGPATLGWSTLGPEAPMKQGHFTVVPRRPSG